MRVRVGCRVEGNKGGKWDNCNSIINKIFFKKDKRSKHILCLLYTSDAADEVY